MNRDHFGIIIKLVVLSLFVGIGLDYFDVSPKDLFENAPQAIARIFNVVWDAIKWGWQYVVLGAIIVIPAWIILNLKNIKNRFR